MFCRPLFDINLRERFKQTFWREVDEFTAVVRQPFTQVSEIVVNHVQSIVKIMLAVLVVEVVVGKVNTEQTDVRGTEIEGNYDGNVGRRYGMIYKRVAATILKQVSPSPADVENDLFLMRP